MLGSASHWVHCRASRNHRVYPIFLFEQEIDQESAGRQTRLVDGGFDVSPCADSASGDAMCLGKLDEIGTDQRRRFIVALVEELLPLAHHAEIAVVDDRDIDLEPFLHNRGELRSSHLEAAIAGDHPDFLRSEEHTSELQS